MTPECGLLLRNKAFWSKFLSGASCLLAPAPSRRIKLNSPIAAFVHGYFRDLIARETAAETCTSTQRCREAELSTRLRKTQNLPDGGLPKGGERAIGRFHMVRCLPTCVGAHSARSQLMGIRIDTNSAIPQFVHLEVSAIQGVPRFAHAI